MHSLQAFFVLLTCIGLSACSKPFSDPDIRSGEPPAAASFHGLAHYLDGEEPLRVIWVHGMCNHDSRWVENRSEIIRTALSASTPTGKPFPDKQDGIEIYNQKFEISGSAGLVVSFVVWSPLTEEHKRILKFDSPEGGYPHKRASLNNKLKITLINECLADAVIYAGTGGETIRTAMQNTVCVAMGGQPQPNNEPEGEHISCSFPQRYTPPRLAFVAESLGSKLLIDAIRALRKTPSSDLAAALSETRTVLLLSNQLPLLDLADLPADGDIRVVQSEDSSLNAFIEILVEARGYKIESLPMLEVVEFTDPNDLLSYRLPPGALSIEGARLVNVAVSNDWTYLESLENPYIAHCGYGENGRVLGLVLKGHTAGESVAFAPPAKEGSC